MNPPTVMSAIRFYVALFGNDVKSKAKSDVLELARFLSELSVCDYFFVTKNPTSVALACILTAFEGVSNDLLLRKQRQKFVNTVFRVTKINCTIEEVHSCRLRLREVYQRGNYHKPKGGTSERRSGGQSPDNVTHRVENNDANMEDESPSDNVAAPAFDPVQIQSCLVNSDPMEP